MLPEVIVVHQAAHRVRILIPLKKRDKGYFSQLEKGLRAACPDILYVKANPTTGSCLILHASNIATILAVGEKANLFKIAPARDMETKDSPENNKTGISTSAVVLVALSAFQVLRG